MFTFSEDCLSQSKRRHNRPPPSLQTDKHNMVPTFVRLDGDARLDHAANCAPILEIKEAAEVRRRPLNERANPSGGKENEMSLAVPTANATRSTIVSDFAGIFVIVSLRGGYIMLPSARRPSK